MSAEGPRIFNIPGIGGLVRVFDWLNRLAGGFGIEEAERIDKDFITSQRDREASRRRQDRSNQDALLNSMLERSEAARIREEQRRVD